MEGDIQRATDINKEVEENTAMLGEVQRCCMPFIRVASTVFLISLMFHEQCTEVYYDV